MKPSYSLVKLNSTTTQVVMPGKAKRPEDQLIKIERICTQIPTVKGK